MTTTTKIAIPTDEWTQVSTGSAVVTVAGNPNGYRLAVGAAEPGDLSTGLIVGRTTDGLFGLSALAGTDNVYIAPIDGNAFTANVLAS